MARSGRKTKSVGTKASRSRSASPDDRGSSLWFRMADEYWWAIALWAERRSTAVHPVMIGEVQEAAIEEFLSEHSQTPFSDYLAAAKASDPKRTLWLSVALLDRIDRMRTRDGVPRARLVYTAILVYLRKLGLRASGADIARLKAQRDAAGGRSWRVVRKEGSRPTPHDLRQKDK